MLFNQLKRIVYPVQDLARAKVWYSDILGTQPLFDAPFASIFAVGSCSLSLSVSTMPDSTSNHGMEVYWEVDDIEEALNTLLQKGALLHTPIASVLSFRTAKVIDPFGNILGITDQGSSANRKTVESKPSETALTVAFCRALAAMDERKELQGHDHLAEIFLNAEAKELLSQEKNRNWAAENLVTLPLYGYFLARTAYIDDVFVDCCRKGIPQIVFLGAGYDTRSIRFGEEIKNTRIFELDIPTTQERKLGRLREAGLIPPEFVSYLPINFEKENIIDVLIEAGYDPTMQTLFIWEGVMYYLTQASIEYALKFIEKHTASKSLLCFDCMREELQSVNAAEPFKFWMSPDEITKLLSSFSLNVIEILDTTDITKRYLTLSDGYGTEKCLTSFFLMLAEKK